eukprot:XP_001706077.1 Hypothetical protein GL50803_36073 [Giardia lamblia ATCC 50803]
MRENICRRKTQRNVRNKSWSLLNRHMGGFYWLTI